MIRLVAVVYQILPKPGDKTEAGGKEEEGGEGAREVCC